MSETPAEYYVSRVPKPIRDLCDLHTRIQKGFAAISVEGRCYVTGLGILLLAAIMTIFKRPETILLGRAGAIVFVPGLLPLIECLYEWEWRRLLGTLLNPAITPRGARIVSLPDHQARLPP